METLDKEVYFDKYCQTCKDANTKEVEWPCNDCLAIPNNVNSHKPVYYKPDSKLTRKQKGEC